jgi:hypothetical protein
VDRTTWAKAKDLIGEGAVTFVFRILNILPPIDRLIRSGRQRFGRVRPSMALDDPTCSARRGQRPASSLALLVWWYQAMIAACLLREPEAFVFCKERRAQWGAVPQWASTR